MSSLAGQFVDDLHGTFAARGCPANAIRMKAYFRGQFEFFGIRSPERRRLIHEHHGDADHFAFDQIKRCVTLLWREPEREMQHTAMELLHHHQRSLTLDDLPLVREMITSRPWWDTVDFIACKILGALLARHPEREAAIAREMSRGDHLWLIRSSVIFQLGRRKRTDERLLSEMILRQADHPDFFIRKAIGWALRDYAKTAPDWVASFVKGNRLSPLSVREALRNI